jgi:hypothetical protein
VPANSKEEKMKYLVTALVANNRRLELATFLRRYEAERYAEQQSGLSGYVYQVENLEEESPARVLAVFNDGEAVFSRRPCRGEVTGTWSNMVPATGRTMSATSTPARG